MQTLRSVMLLLALVITVHPAKANQQIASLPPIKPFTSAYFELAVQNRGHVVIVGQGRIENPQRMYYVLSSVGEPARPFTLEVVVYDGSIYQRIDQETTWRSAEQGVTPPAIPTLRLSSLAGDPISDLGPSTIAGTLTEHYQIWAGGLTDPATGSTTTVDLFVGSQVPYLYQLQYNIYREAVSSELVSGTVIRFFGHDSPGIVVTPPSQLVSPQHADQSKTAP